MAKKEKCATENSALPSKTNTKSPYIILNPSSSIEDGDDDGGSMTPAAQTLRPRKKYKVKSEITEGALLDKVKSFLKKRKDKKAQKKLNQIEKNRINSHLASISRIKSPTKRKKAIDDFHLGEKKRKHNIDYHKNQYKKYETVNPEAADYHRRKLKSYNQSVEKNNSTIDRTKIKKSSPPPHPGLYRWEQEEKEMAKKPLNELSKKTLASYVKKAARSVQDKTFYAGEWSRGNNKDKERSRDLHIKAHNRIKHINKAADRLAKEDVQHLDENKAKRYIVKVHVKNPKNKNDTGEHRLFHSSSVMSGPDLAIANAKKHYTKNLGLEVISAKIHNKLSEEQIDEISKKRLLSYLNKGGKDLDQLYKIRHHSVYGRASKDDEYKLKRNFNKRITGLTRASNRFYHPRGPEGYMKDRAGYLAKEDVEQIDEISKGKLKNYLKRALNDVRNNNQAVGRFDKGKYIGGREPPDPNDRELLRWNKRKARNREAGSRRAIDRLADPNYGQAKKSLARSYEKSMGESYALIRKSNSSGIPVSILREVFDRGIEAYHELDESDLTASQFAFDRVNSFISGGEARQLDKDLLDELEDDSK